MSNLFDVTDKIVLITGASRGLGFTFAKGFLNAGATVIINSKTQSKLDNAIDKLKLISDNVYGYCFDVTNTHDVEYNIKKIIQDIGYIDVLVNNAGIHKRAPFLEMSKDVWDNVIDVNLSSLFFVSQTVAKYMVKRKSGRIINISSLNSIGVRPTIANYCTSKGGVNVLTKSMAEELGVYNINVNAIAPGYFITEMTSHFLDDEKFNSWVKSETMLNRWGYPEELVGAAIFLASKASSYLTGQVLIIDGGWSSSL